MIYLLRGEPLAYREYKGYRAIWNDYKQEHLKRLIDLESQHGEKNPIGGPIHIDYVFSFDVRAGRSHKITTRHTERPTIDDLIRFVNVLAKGRIFNPEAVVSFSARKIYSTEPHTSFTIRHIEKGEQV